MSAQVLYCMSVPPSGSSDKHMEDYLNTLFDRCEHGFIEIRRPVSQGFWHSEWISLDDQTLPMFPNDENVFIGVATRKNKYEGGGRNNLFQIPAVWLDIDFKFTEEVKAREHIKEFSLKPSMIVHSGKGLHLYWLLENPAEPEDIRKIEEVNKNLARHFEGDKKTADAAHVMRLPGTYNQKYHPAPLVTIESYTTDKVYRIEDFNFLHLPSPPTQTQSAATDKNNESYVDLLYGVEKGNRHDALIRLASLCKRIGTSKDETKKLLLHWNQNNPEPEDEKELIYQIEDIYSRHSQREEYSETIQDYTSVIESSVMHLPAFMHKTLPIRPYIINPLLKKGELIMISAARGVGKTWVALSLGFMATRQLRINNWETGTLTATLYIDGEISEDEMQDRILKLKIGRKAEQVPFYLLSSDEMRSNDKRSPNLNNPSWRSSISEYLKSHPDIGLVILDNLSSLTPGRDENKKRDWDEINGWLLELRSKGVAVIFLHHEGKGGDQRGTSAIEDNINFSIRLKRPEGYRKEDGTKFVVEFTKSRRLHGENIKSFTLKLQEEGMVLDWKVIADEEQNTEAQIIKSLKEGMKQKDIAKTLGVSASWVSQVVTKAKEEERIKRIDAVLGDDEEQIKDASEAEEVEIGDDVEVIEE